MKELFLNRVLMVLRYAYHSIPLSAKSKAKHRLHFRRVFPTKFFYKNNLTIGFANEISRANKEHQKKKSSLVLESISFEGITSPMPIVSIIIPVYGKVDYTLRCLSSILRYLPTCAFEIIIIDDKSSDDSEYWLSDIKGIKYYRNLENLGFIKASNIGASYALGDYLYFLNNDTSVLPGFLDELYDTFKSKLFVGLVGSKLIYPDGLLQEAGGIIWQDGSAWNFGKFQDHCSPEFNYLRPVDYCSGASIMVPKDLFFRLGKFNEFYCPAYCEDSDLALNIRASNYLVVYQPKSVVIHYEGVTSGNEITSGIKSYQSINSEKLFFKWEKHLSHHRKNGVDAQLEKDRGVDKRILIIDHITPTPDKDAGSVTMVNIMLVLKSMGLGITFVPEDNFTFCPKYTDYLQKEGVECLYLPYVSTVKEHLIEYGDRYDLVLLSRPSVANAHYDVVRKCCPGAKIIYYSHDLHYLRMSREIELLGNNSSNSIKDVIDMREMELEIFKKADAGILVSDNEKAIVQKFTANQNLHVLPLLINVDMLRVNSTNRKDLLFIGGFNHLPNRDAIKYFVAEIMPILRLYIPGIRLNIVGSNPSEDIVKLADDDVIVHGYVENINTMLTGALLSIAPLRYGAGVKGKIATSMAAGLPVVSSSIGVEGMNLTHNSNIMIANSISEFVSSIIQLYNDSRLWSQISKNGILFAEKNWGADAALKHFSEILKSLDFELNERVGYLKLYQQ